MSVQPVLFVSVWTGGLSFPLPRLRVKPHRLPPETLRYYNMDFDANRPDGCKCAKTGSAAIGHPFAWARVR